MKTAIATLESLTPEQRITHNARMTVYTMVAEATTSESVARVERAVQDSNSALPAARAAIAALGASLV